MTEFPGNFLTNFVVVPVTMSRIYRKLSINVNPGVIPGNFQAGKLGKFNRKITGKIPFLPGNVALGGLQFNKLPHWAQIY